MRLALATGLIVLGFAAAGAGDFPTSGVLNGKIDRDFMEYQCSPSDEPNEISCQFNQISVSKKAKPDQLAKRLEKVTDWLKESSDPKKRMDCGPLAPALEAMRTGKLPPGGDASKFAEFQGKPAREKQDTLDLMSSLMMVCQTPTRENMEQFVRLEFDKDLRTCVIVGNRFEQSFKRSGDTWVHNKGPDGDCGVIYVTKFVKDPAGTTGLIFWNYSTRKIITNKEAKTTFGLACSLLDETEYPYDWRKEEYYKGCDYVTYMF